MTTPEMAGWNLLLRFGLEVGALVGLGAAAWKLSPEQVRWIAVVTVPLGAATVWGVFNVVGDPSRSGAAPIEVAGWIRLAIELLILAGGAIALWLAGHRNTALVFGLLVAAHYATSWSRITWLLER